MAGLYANENLSATLVRELRRFGHDVLTSYEAGNANQRIQDDDVLTTATTNKRCVITFNRQDFINLHRTGISHAGIIICKDNREHHKQALIVHTLLSEQKTLKNRLFRVLKQNQPKASQPAFIVKEYLRS